MTVPLGNGLSQYRCDASLGHGEVLDIVPGHCRLSDCASCVCCAVVVQDEMWYVDSIVLVACGGCYTPARRGPLHRDIGAHMLDKTRADLLNDGDPACLRILR